MDDNHWEQNEHGLWCPACGYLVARADNGEDDGVPDEYIPQVCRQCGFPDFEDGIGYFTDEE